MKKYIFLSAALLLLTASCSNDDNNNETKEQVQAVQFSFTNEDFGEDETLTRSAETAKPQIVDLGDCEAEITVESEPTAKTRGTLSPANGHYTIHAYQAGTLKGEMSGTFSGGTFTPDASSHKMLNLPYGTYDFVAFNDDVTVSGTNLTTPRAKAETARMGFATVNITSPTPIQVLFTMKHVGCRLRTQFVCKKDMPSNITATLEATASNVIPTSVVYNPTTKSYIGTNGAIAPETNNSPASTETKYVASNYGENYSYTSTCADYHYFLPTTEGSKLKLNFSAGTVFWKPLTGTIPQLSATLLMQPGKSYFVKIKLKPQFTYLMSDGTTGYFKETTSGGGTKTPVAVVLDKDSHIGVALHGLSVMRWCKETSPYYYTQANTHMVTNLADALNSLATSGYDETWDPNYSTSAVTGNKVKGLNPDFPAFKNAADYDPGVTYTGTPALKWYLPSLSDFKWVYPLGFGDKTEMTQINHQYVWYGNLASLAFEQIPGNWGLPTAPYLASTECDSSEHGVAFCYFKHIEFYTYNKYIHFNNVRPFVKY